MKTILSFAIAIIFSITSFGQVIFESNFQEWNDTIPVGWIGTKTSIEIDSISMLSGGEFGTNLCGLNNTENSHKRFTTAGLPVVEGQTYEIEFWVQGMAEVRTNIWDSNYGNYNSYISIDAATSENYTQTVVADTTFSMAEFIISFRNTTNFSLDSVVVKTADAVEATEVTIYEIQYTTDISGDSPYVDQPVITGGIVSAVTGQGYFIQDGAGAWNGVYVYDGDNAVAIGDDITVTGSVVEYFTLTEITNVTDVVINSSNNSILPSMTTSGGAASEMWEGVFAYITTAECVEEIDQYGTWSADDGSGVLRVDDVIFDMAPTLGNMYTVSGPITYTFGEFKMFSMDGVEISVAEQAANTIAIYPSPCNQSLTIEMNDDFDVAIYSIDGKLVYNAENLTTKTTINTDTFATGLYVVKVIQGTNISSSIVEKK